MTGRQSPIFSIKTLLSTATTISKKKVNHLLDSSGAPLLLGCCVWNVYDLFSTALLSVLWIGEPLLRDLKDKVISMIIRFWFWDPILYKHDESRGGKSFPLNPMRLEVALLVSQNQ